MSGQKTILVIDDSATIRKLVDTHLSPLGYDLFLAANAEDGLRLADQVNPDLILLDHQLPGTTGYEVCRQLVQSERLRQIPVVVSSTLRKRAYAEYTELDNVVDMLPKPYTEELLRTTVANALETGAMVMASQSQGGAVPEVIEAVGDTDLAGSFASFGLREVLDFLNNGHKTGVLEIEAERTRLWFGLDRGHIQGVTATGIDPQEITQTLPESLENLAPILKLTIGGRSCTEVDGFVQLLDRKVLDPRLMTRLLLHQAAVLVRLAFTRKLTAFRFESAKSVPPLHRKLPLDVSLLALLVEGAMHCDPSQLPAENPGDVYVRRAIRGQNLDRAGLSARHMKILGLLSEPRDVQQLAQQLAWDPLEVRRVLHGFVMAELVEVQRRTAGRQFVIYETDPAVAQHLRSALRDGSDRYAGKVVRDPLALQLLLKRVRPDALAFTADDEASCQTIGALMAAGGAALDPLRTVAICASSADDTAGLQVRLGFVPDAMLNRPYTLQQLYATFDRLMDGPCSIPSDVRVATPPVSTANVTPIAAAGVK